LRTTYLVQMGYVIAATGIDFNRPLRELDVRGVYTGRMIWTLSSIPAFGRLPQSVEINRHRKFMQMARRCKCLQLENAQTRVKDA